MPNPKVIATNLFLVLLAGGTWWLAESLVPREISQSKADDSQIDYYSQNVRRTVLTPEGHPKEILVADRMTHYKNDDRTDMDKPVMTLYKKKGEQPWIIRSETGSSLSQGKTVLLHGDVMITRKNDKGEEIRIITRDVKYIPDEDYAETAEDVLMLAPNDTTRGKGAEVYFEPFLKINLLADVRRKHETH